MSGLHDYTQTPYLGLYKPIANMAVGTWGDLWNSNADAIDSAIHFASGGGPFLPLAGGTVSGNVNLWPSGNGQVNIGLNHTYTTTPTTAVWTNVTFGGAVTDNSTVQNVLTAVYDAVDATGAQGGGSNNIRNTVNLQAGGKGGRTAFGVHLSQTGATNINDIHQYYVASAVYAEAAYSAGGAVGNILGSLFASNDSALLKTGAGAYWNGIIGYELDVGVQAGVGVAYKQGMKIVLWDSDAVAGSAGADFCYSMNTMGAGSQPGWDVGYCIGSPDGWWPIKAATGKLIGTVTGMPGGRAYAAQWGIDFSAVAFSGGLIRGPGYSVDGAGQVSPHLTNAANDAAAATAGVPIGTLYRNGNAVQVRLT